MDWLNRIIFLKQEEIDKRIKQKSIDNDIEINGSEIKTIKGIVKINGSLLIRGSVESLGDIKEVTGDLYANSSLKSLGNLERVGNELQLRRTKINDLGNLIEVGGTLKLMDTEIKSLGILNYVGGNLNLPLKMKGKIDLSRITVKGKVFYYKDSPTIESNFVKPKKEINYSYFDGIVPELDPVRGYSLDNFRYASFYQKEFYKKFKELFLNEVFIDLKSNNYYSILQFEIREDYKKHRDIERYKKESENFDKYYNFGNDNYEGDLLCAMETRSDYIEEAWNLRLKNGWIFDFQVLAFYEEKLQKKLLDGEIIARYLGLTYQSEFVRKNLDQIIKFIPNERKKYEEEKKMDFFECFFIKRERYNKLDNSVEKKTDFQFKVWYGHELRVDFWHDFHIRDDLDYYKQFFLREQDYYDRKKIEDNQDSGNIPSPFRGGLIVSDAIKNQLRILILQAENSFRESIGLKKVGEGWFSETELYYHIKEAFSELEVVKQGQPKWLGLQRFDIYIPIYKIAIEYQGLQHFEAIDFFGGEEGLRNTQERDIRKRELCLINDTHLIEVLPNYNLNEIISQIKTLINERQNPSKR